MTVERGAATKPRVGAVWEVFDEMAVLGRSGAAAGSWNWVRGW